MANYCSKCFIIINSLHPRKTPMKLVLLIPLLQVRTLRPESVVGPPRTQGWEVEVRQTPKLELLITVPGLPLGAVVWCPGAIGRGRELLNTLGVLRTFPGRGLGIEDKTRHTCSTHKGHWIWRARQSAKAKERQILSHGVLGSGCLPNNSQSSNPIEGWVCS